MRVTAHTQHSLYNRTDRHSAPAHFFLVYPSRCCRTGLGQAKSDYPREINVNCVCQKISPQGVQSHFIGTFLPTELSLESGGRTFWLLTSHVSERIAALWLQNTESESSGICSRRSTDTTKG